MSVCVLHTWESRESKNERELPEKEIEVYVGICEVRKGKRKCKY